MLAGFSLLVPLAVVGMDGLQDGLMIGFGPAVERRQDVDPRLPRVQFVEMSTLGRTDKCDQTVALELHFLAGVEIEITHFEGDARAGLALGFVQGIVSGDQAVVNRIAQVG